MSTADAGHLEKASARSTLLAVRMIYTALSSFFLCFYFAFGALQFINAHGRWLPASMQRPSTILGAVNLVLVLAAGLSYGLAWWLRVNRADLVPLGLWTASVASIAALITHLITLNDTGFAFGAGGYASVFVLIEGMFLVLLVVTAIILVGLANRARLGLYRESTAAIQAGGEFLAWICTLAVINFLALYVEAFHPL